MRSCAMPLRRLMLAIALLWAAGAAGGAAQKRVDLELVIAVDVSWSMDQDEQWFQREGFVAAFRHRAVIAAIAEGGWGAIAVSYMEWAGYRSRHVQVPWTLIDGAKTARAFADLLEVLPIGYYQRTSISGAMESAAQLFAQSPYRGLRRVLDISGDGANNQGPRVDETRDWLVGRRITVNGLPIMIKKTNPSGYIGITNLDDYFRACVIGGPGAFLVPVTDKGQFALAIQRKLVLEIAQAPGVQRPRLRRAQLTIPTNPVDCLIGEKIWRQWRGSMDFDDM